MSSTRNRRGVARLRRPMVVLAALAVALAPAAAQTPVAEMHVGKTAIKWSPVIEHDKLVLVVSGPGGELRREFGGGKPPYLEIGDPKEGGLADGSYSYELRVIPKVDPEVREKLSVAREAMDQGRRVDLAGVGPASKGPFVQSGTFSVREGAFVQPGEREPERESKQTGDVRMDGSLEVAGAKKFVAADPTDADRELAYVALEGPEAGTYHRGTARTVGGEAVIELPGHFAALTEAEGLTVQLTPAGRWSRLYVVERSPRRLVVASADGEDVEFDYLVQGVRKGYAGFQVERPATAPSEER